MSDSRYGQFVFFNFCAVTKINYSEDSDTFYFLFILLTLVVNPLPWALLRLFLVLLMTLEAQ